MQVTFGKFAGKSVEFLMLKEPSYIKWIMAQQEPTGAMANVREYILGMIQILDAKPLVGKQCYGKTCNNAAARFTVYSENIDPYWWCDNCNPYQTGANAGKLQAPNDYQNALQHIEFFCRDRKSEKFFHG